MRRRRGRRRHPPAVPVVVVAVCDGTAGHVASGGGKRDPGECDCGEGRDEFHLVHCRVPFIVPRKPILALTHG